MEMYETNRKPGQRKYSYSKEFRKQVLKTISQCRAIGLQWKEIEKELQSMYGIKEIGVFRKQWNLLNEAMLVDTTIDTHTSLDLLAKAKNQILKDRKINTKQRNMLNAEMNVQAYRDMILAILSDFKWKTYKTITPMSKVALKRNKPLNKAIFIVSDEHFKGKCDILHLNYVYDRIEQDILDNKYQEIELWYLGDGVDGLIHTGCLASNDGAITPAIEYINILIERVNKIKQVKSVKFIAQSNHTQTRPLNTSRNELAREDLNYMLINTMKYGLRKDIELVADDIIHFKYDNMSVAMLHGHQPYAKNKNRLIEYWSAKYHEVPDLIIMGHYHQFKISEYGLNKWLVVCPTAKNFNGDFENVNGFISYSQITKMTIKNKIPTFEILNVRKEN